VAKSKLSEGMRRVLENMADDKPAHGPLTGGLSEAGGRQTVMRALYMRGFIAGGKVTPAGLEAIGRNHSVGEVGRG
jgi:hypothetical protein